MIEQWRFPLLMIIFTLVSIVILYYLRNRHKEKMELIKKGETIVSQDALQQMKLSNLAKGIISISLALGIFMGYILETYTNLEAVVSYISMILLFFGIGTLSFYALIKSK